MKTRQTSYGDYGIDKAEINVILEFCKNANDEWRDIIRAALDVEMDKYKADVVFKALTEGISYDVMFQQDYLYMTKQDFYGYRRKGMEAVKRWMILYNIWDTAIT